MIVNGGDGYHDLVIDFQNGDSAELRAVMLQILPDALRLFAEKNEGYTKPSGDDVYNLGPRGEFVEISRKVRKLHLGIWDENPAAFETESKEEVVRDLIGHCLLMLKGFCDGRV